MGSLIVLLWHAPRKAHAQGFCCVARKRYSRCWGVGVHLEVVTDGTRGLNEYHGNTVVMPLYLARVAVHCPYRPSNTEEPPQKYTRPEVSRKIGNLGAIMLRFVWYTPFLE